MGAFYLVSVAQEGGIIGTEDPGLDPAQKDVALVFWTADVLLRDVGYWWVWLQEDKLYGVDRFNLEGGERAWFKRGDPLELDPGQLADLKARLAQMIK